MKAFIAALIGLTTLGAPLASAENKISPEACQQSIRLGKLGFSAAKEKAWEYGLGDFALNSESRSPRSIHAAVNWFLSYLGDEDLRLIDSFKKGVGSPSTVLSQLEARLKVARKEANTLELNQWDEAKCRGANSACLLLTDGFNAFKLGAERKGKVGEVRVITDFNDRYSVIADTSVPLTNDRERNHKALDRAFDLLTLVRTTAVINGHDYDRFDKRESYYVDEHDYLVRHEHIPPICFESQTAGAAIVEARSTKSTGAGVVLTGQKAPALTGSQRHI